MEEEKKTVQLTRNYKILMIALVILAILSATLLGSIFSKEENFGGTYQSLDDKRNTVAEMMTASVAASAAITLIPGDAGTPIAEKLADLSGYMIFILSAIFLEKWLLTFMGLFAFRFVIPIALLLIVFAIWKSSPSIRVMGIKLIVFALVMFLAVPASVLITKQIDDSYNQAAQEQIDDANEESDKIQEDEGLIDSLTVSAKEELEKFENLLGGFVESIAKLIVTTCVVPIAVILFMLWVVKMLFGVSVKIPIPRKK